MLEKSGIDYHKYVPSQIDFQIITQSDLIILNGGSSENWIFEILKNHENHYPGNTRSKDPLEKRLTGFVNYNRFRYREIDNRYGDYSEDRKKLLDSIGFEWNPNYNYKKCANKKPGQ